MDAIIGQFLHYAKPSDTSSFEKINMSLLLEDIAQTAMRQTDVLINADITPNLWVFGNKTELQRVIDNLIENARRYGKNEDLEVVKIDLYCRLQHSKVIIHIDDHGPGIPVTEIERLLRPFTRLDAARGQANGSGLGLAIVSRIVQYHKGRLQLRNHDDGLTVQIELPLIH